MLYEFSVASRLTQRSNIFLIKNAPHHPKYVAALLLDQGGATFLGLNLVLLNMNYLLLQLELEL